MTNFYLKKNRQLYYLNSILMKYIFKVVKRKHLYITTSISYFYNLLFFLKMHYNIWAKLFINLSGLDFLSYNNRFFLSYNLLSYLYGTRYSIYFYVKSDLVVPSITKLYYSSSWYEREVFDLYGIFFENNFDLRRILTDYIFSGHPLRKDYPLTGFFEVKYEEKFKSVCYRRVRLIQEYRFFESDSVWSYF